MRVCQQANERKRNMQILGLDQQNDRKRQKQLYSNDLEFDPNRPLYQHSINFQNYIKDQSNESLRQLALNIRNSFMKDQAKLKVIDSYLDIEQKIDNLDHGHMFQLNQQVIKKMAEIKGEIQKFNNQIEVLNRDRQQNQKTIKTLTAQIQAYSIFASENYNLLEQLKKISKGYAENEVKHAEQKQETLKTIKQLIKSFSQQYASVQNQFKALMHYRNQLKAEKQKLELQQFDRMINEKQLRKLEDEVEIVRIELEIQQRQEKRQQQKYEKRRHENLQNSSSVDSIYQDIANPIQIDDGYSLPTYKIVQQKKYHIIKQSNTKYFRNLLIAATIILALLSFFAIKSL